MYYKKNYGVMPRTIGGMLEDVFQAGWNIVNDEVTAFYPPVNIQEKDKGYDLHVVAPGLSKEDFKISVDRNILNISFEHKEEKQEGQEGKWLRSEYKTKSFKRSFTLTEKIDAGKINAKYENGILFITLPKKEVTEQPANVITVS